MLCNIWDFLFPGLDGGRAGLAKAQVMAVLGVRSCYLPATPVTSPPASPMPVMVQEKL